MIRIKNLSKTFDKSCNVDALKNVNLSIEAGDVCGVIGMSGAGKSTLLRCIAMLETPSSGSIEIDGRDIFSLKGKELLDLKKSLGVVFQGYNLLMQRSIRQNIAFPLELIKMPKDQIAKRVDELLCLVGLSDKAEEYPSQLSGGQRQRVAIARALASNPKVLLCDEPTGALDYQTGKAILKLLQDTCRQKGMTVVVITHNMAIAPMADQVIRFKNGQVRNITRNSEPTPVEQIEW